MMDLEMRSLYGDKGTEITEDSRDKTLRELPPYQGPYEEGSDVMILPSQKKAHKPVMDSHTRILVNPCEMYADDC